MIIGPHKNVRRFQDQYCCDSCGRSWDVDDNDLPPCRKPMASRDAVLEQARKLREGGNES